MRSAIFCLCALLSACGGHRAVVSGASGNGADLSRVLLSKVAARWPGAVVASSPQAPACDDGVERASTIARADLNADGTADIGLRLTIGDNVHVAAAIARLGENYDLFDAGAAHDPSPLGVARVGRVYHDPVTGFDQYFSIDTLVQVACGQAGTAYFWNGTGFVATPIVMGPGPVSAPPAE